MLIFFFKKCILQLKICSSNTLTYTYHRPLAAMLGSASFGSSIFLVFFTITLSNVVGLLQNFVHVYSATDNINKCCKFGYCMIFTFSCVHILWLNRTPFLKSFFTVTLSNVVRLLQKICTHSNQICSICLCCLWHYVYKIL